MSTRDAAVRAVAEALHEVWCHVDPDPQKDARTALIALATSADVRAGLVASFRERFCATEWQTLVASHLDDLVDAVLAALGGAG